MGFELCHPAVNLIYSVLVMYGMLKQTETVYNPKIIITSITFVSYLFCTGYAYLCRRNGKRVPTIYFKTAQSKNGIAKAIPFSKNII